MFDGHKFPYKLLLALRQRIKLKIAFENNMSADIKQF